MVNAHVNPAGLVQVADPEGIVPPGKYPFFYVEAVTTVQLIKQGDTAAANAHVELRDWEGVATVYTPTTRLSLYEDVVRASRRHLFNSDEAPKGTWKVYIFFG
jgi:hypothetical protein